MCSGRDARINNSRVISHIIIRYIQLYIKHLRPSVCQPATRVNAIERDRTRSTLGVYAENVPTSLLNEAPAKGKGRTINSRRKPRHRIDVFSLACRESLICPGSLAGWHFFFDECHPSISRAAANYGGCQHPTRTNVEPFRWKTF